MLTADWTDADIQAYLDLCHTLGTTDPRVFVSVWAHESNNETWAHNPGGASGLFQLEADTAKGLGYPVASDPGLALFRKMSVSGQLPWAARYYAGAKLRLQTIGEVYVWTFLPAQLHVAAELDGMVCAEAGPYASAYRDNWTAFDPGKRGAIYVSDLVRTATEAASSPRNHELLGRILAVAAARDTLPEADSVTIGADGVLDITVPASD